MNTEKIKQIATFYKVSEDKVIDNYNESKEFVDKQFSSLSDEQKEIKTLSITASKFKTNMGNNTNDYKGIVLGVSGIIDSNKYQRDNQLKLYNQTKAKAEQAGDMSMLDDLYGKVVNVDNDGNVTALFPYLKNDGNVSAMAGKEIPNEIDSQIRKVYGVAYTEGKNPEEDIKVFNLSLKGKALNNIPPMGKIVSFKGGGKEYKDEFQLNSSVTDFVEVEDEYLQKGINEVGIDGIFNQFFENHIVTYDDIQEWVNNFKDNKEENAVPKEFRGYVVIDSNNCMSQNFEPNDKGKCNMMFCDDNFNMDNNVTIISGVFPEIAEKIEFASNSTCTILGQLSIFGDDEPMVYMTLFGAVPKEGMYVPRIKADPIADEEEKPVTTETKSEEPDKENPKPKAW